MAAISVTNQISYHICHAFKEDLFEIRKYYDKRVIVGLDRQQDDNSIILEAPVVLQMD